MLKTMTDKEIAKKVDILKNKHDALTDEDIHLILCHRAKIMKKLMNGADADKKVASAHKYYSPVYYDDDGTRRLDVDKSSQACINFIQDWGMIYNPHRDNLKTLPIVLFPRQKEYVRWLLALYAENTNGCVDKCRDVGATWIAVGLAVWMFLFEPGITLGFCTFKAEECDKMGDLSTLLPKARFFLDNLPNIFTGKIGKDWTTKQYGIRNVRNGSSIRGLYGKSPGRSGRSTIVFKDESAFYENADEVEASLNANAALSVDISTPNGTETLFYRKKRGILTQIEKYGVHGVVPLFTFDWQDNPNHTQEWFERKKREAEHNGTMHLFKREILRDETSSLSDRVIPNAYITAAIDSHVIFADKFPLTGRRAGFDVANSEVDGDSNTYVAGQGNRVDKIEEWSGIDALNASKKVWKYCLADKIGTLVFDTNGVGATASNHFREQEDKQDMKIQGTAINDCRMPEDFVTTEFVPFVSHAKPLRADTYEYSQDITNAGMFRDCKAQAWWHLRLMFENTWRAVNGQKYDPEMLISINYADANEDQKILFQRLIEELSQPTWSPDKNKIIIDKKPKSARSPNLADALVMMMAPLDTTFDLSVIV